MHFMERLVNPRSIAFYGANEKILTNMGTQQLLNIIDSDYRGRLYPIHPKLTTVLGLPAYPSIDAVPEVPDLAIVILATRIIPQIFEELGKKGVKHVILVTAGFRETANASGEQEIKAIADKYGIRFLGPNCIGMMNSFTHYSETDPSATCLFNCTWVSYPMGQGNVSIASQSGTLACHTFMLLKERHLNMSKSLSIGNEANIDVCDCLEYFESDPTTEVILLYIEELKRGRHFLEIARRVTPKKPIIALYVGGTPGGARAVSSHTGSMAGSDAVFDGAFEQAGIIRVYSIEEMFDAAMLFSQFVPKGIIPKGKRIAVVTNAGGPGATMSDLASRLGLLLPNFSPDLQAQLRQYMPPTAQAQNPLDYTFSINPSAFFDAVPKLLAKSGEIDAMVIYGAYGAKFFSYRGKGNEFLNSPGIQHDIQQYLEFFEAAVDSSRRILKKYHVPIIYVNFLGLNDPVFEYLNDHGFPTFQMEHRAVIAVNHLINYGLYLAKISNYPM
jgi:acyl-CoA synthetase (NDP forming)